MPDESKFALMEQYKKRISELPTLPSSLVRLMRLLSVEDFRIDNISQIVSADQSLTAHILKIINSAYYGLKTKVTDLRYALALLGQRKISSIIYTCSIIYVFRSRSEVVNLELLWKHGFACGLISEKLARLGGYGDPEMAYICGLLHDFGIVAEIQCFPNQFRAVIERLESAPMTLQDAEIAVFGLDHADFGFLVSQKYNLPADIAEAVSFHHRPQELENGGALPAIVNVADLLCKLTSFGHGLPEILPASISGEPGWAQLREKLPRLREMDLSVFLQEMERYQVEVQTLTEGIYGR